MTNPQTKQAGQTARRWKYPMGYIVIAHIYGRFEECRVLKDHGLGTIDVEIVKTGKRFRVSGLGKPKIELP